MARDYVTLERDAQRGKLSYRTVTLYRNKNWVTVDEARALNTLIADYQKHQEGVEAQRAAGRPTLRGLLRAIASGTAYGSDQWKEFILMGSDRALPELEGDRLNRADNKNISFLLNWRAEIRARIQAGELDDLVAEFEAPLAMNGVPNGDLKWLYKAIASNSQRNIFKGKVADATANGKAIDSAISSNFGVYGNWLWHFSRWGQTWGTIVQSFLGLIELVKKIGEGGLTPEDVQKYRDDKGTFQGDFLQLQNQQYLLDLEAWDPQEFLQLKPAYDSKVPGSEDEPLFWHPDLAHFMTEEVLGSVIVVDQSNFLDHKGLAEMVLAEQDAILRFLRGAKALLREEQDVLGPDLRLAGPVITGGVGFVVGFVLANFAGFPGEKAWSLFPAVILAILGAVFGSRLNVKFGMFEVSWTLFLLAFGSCSAFSSAGVVENQVTTGQITQAAANAKTIGNMIEGVAWLGAIWLAGLFLLRWAQRRR